MNKSTKNINTSTLKTKKKMNTLKSLIQTGGASNTKLLFSRNEYKNNYDLIFNNLILYKHDNNPTFTKKNDNISNHLIDKLNELMTLKKTNDNEIDLSFINEIYSFPYLDVAGYFAIKKSKDDNDKIKYEFVHNGKHQIYDISTVISEGTGAGDILLLKKKSDITDVDDYPDELVLKLYNKKTIDVEKDQSAFNSHNKADYNFIKRDSIRDYGYKNYTCYSSLKIFEVSKKGSMSLQGNYYKISFDTFKEHNQAFNLNSHNCLIENFNSSLLVGGGDNNNNNNDNSFHSATSSPRQSSAHSSRQSSVHSPRQASAHSPRSPTRSPRSSAHSPRSPSRSPRSPTRSPISPSRSPSLPTSSPRQASSHSPRTSTHGRSSTNAPNNINNELNYTTNIPTNSIELLGHTDKKYIYLAAAYDDFINEYIQQLIMKAVLTKYDTLKKTTFINNIMNFYNAMVIPVVEGRKTNYYGCLIMEKVDGNMRDFLQLETISDDRKIKELRDCINVIDKVLKILKNPNNCFCHTDLKLENVFYKKLPDNKYKFILADYDKSSITFNKIRFYNNGYDSFLRSYNISNFAGFSYIINKENKTYTITRPKLGTSSPIISKLEGEQLLLRYNPFPTMLKFDINMFILSIYFNALHIFSFLTDGSISNTANDTLKKSREELIKLTTTYTGLNLKNCKNIRNTYSTSLKSNYSKYNGNFGLLLFYSTILNKIPHNYDYKPYNFYINKSINLSLLSENNKLIISNGLSNMRNDKAAFTPIGQSSTATDLNTLVDILYTGNQELNHKKMIDFFSNKKYIYFKTNRYSQQSGMLTFEWDYCPILNDNAEDENDNAEDEEKVKKYIQFWNFVKASINQ